MKQENEGSMKKEWGRDLLTALKYGAVLSTAGTLLLLAGGFLFGGFSLEKALNVCRGGLCIISGLSLFLVAGAILTRRNEMIKEDSQWRRKFKKFGYIGVILIVSFSFIVWAVIADWMTRIV